MNIFIEDHSHKKFSFAGFILALPAILLWLSAGAWSFWGLGLGQNFMDLSAKLPSTAQLVVFAGFPIATLFLGIAAYRKTPGKASMAVILSGAILIILTVLVLAL